MAEVDVVEMDAELAELAELEKQFDEFEEAVAAQGGDDDEAVVVKKEKSEKERKKEVARERKEVAAKQKQEEKDKRRRVREEKRNEKLRADAYRAVNASLKTTSLTLCDVFNGTLRKESTVENGTTQPPSTPIDLIASQNSFSGLPTFDTVESFTGSSPTQDFVKVRRFQTKVEEEEDGDSDDCELELVDEVVEGSNSNMEVINNEESNQSFGSAADIDENRLRDRHELMMFRQVASSSVKFDIDSTHSSSVLDLLDRSRSTSIPTNKRTRSLLRTASGSASDIALLRKQSTVDTSSGQPMYSKNSEKSDPMTPSSCIPGMRRTTSTASQLHSLLSGSKSKAEQAAKKRKLN
eukprot:TRINITY_DN26475_c0_g1_i1.p2 TRINITY_DN26475_c0_g1~~TRINITY_DN26475_c0_g1_i1.p2  ORF type:complete len:365 (+),score=100.52 TRINITY_DN26475_c0_g1_i1:41-1096(+)